MLLDTLKSQFERVLGHIFAKYATPPTTQSSATISSASAFGPEELLHPQESAVLDSEGLDRFAEATNGQVFSEDAKEELQFLDVSIEGYLT